MDIPSRYRSVLNKMMFRYATSLEKDASLLANYVIRPFLLIPVRVDADTPDASKIVHYKWYTRPRESRRQRGLV
jgi:hypothetical protein